MKHLLRLLKSASALEALASFLKHLLRLLKSASALEPTAGKKLSYFVVVKCPFFRALCGKRFAFFR
jgi:hypothetical protein